MQVQSVRYRSQTGHDPNGYNPMNYQHMHLIDQWQTNGHDQLSMSLRTQTHDLHCQINGQDLQLIHFKQGHHYYLAVIKAESLYQLSIFIHVRLELGLNSVITKKVLTLADKKTLV